ncbi:MAG: phage holin family protein [Maribacter sp.]
MAFEEVKENIAEAEVNFKAYIEHSSEYYKLKGFKFLMKGITYASKALMVSIVALMAIFFLSIAASFGLGQQLNNNFYGFLIVGLFYVLIGIILFLLRHKIDKPLLKKFSEFYFDES